MLFRYFYLIGFLTCLVLISLALYMQYSLDMEPCPLCVFQRMVIIVIGILFLLAGIHNPNALGRKIYGLSSMLVSIIGAGLSWRHLWLQNLPEDQVPSCGPGLEFMMETLPFQGVIEKVLKGSGECHDINWVFLGLTIPGWTLVLFSLFFLFGLYQIFSQRR